MCKDTSCWYEAQKVNELPLTRKIDKNFFTERYVIILTNANEAGNAGYSDDWKRQAVEVATFVHPTIWKYDSCHHRNYC